MCAASRSFSPTTCQVFERVLTDSLQHSEPHVPGCLLFTQQQAILDQGSQRLQQIFRISNSKGFFYGVKGAAACKDRKVAKERLLSFGEKVVAPFKGGTQRLLPGGEVACPMCQHRQP